MGAQQTNTTSSLRYRRHARNYLIDRRFQLKYSAYFVGIALFFGVSLGVVVWTTSRAVIDESRLAVRQGEAVVARGKEVVAESQKVTEVVKMTILHDPDYSQNSALSDAFRSDSEQRETRLVEDQARLVEQSKALKSQSAALERGQRTLLITLVVSIFLVIIVVGLMGIVVTHKVAGPIHKMTRQIRALGEGHWQIPDKIRKGDELVHFFETFEKTVKLLRARQEHEIADLDRAIQDLSRRMSEAELEPLRRLRAEMQGMLDP